MSKLSYNARINLVYEFLKSKPGYLKKSQEIIGELTGEKNSEIIRLAKELFRNVERYNEGWIEPYLGGDPDNVLVIGDPHEPFTKEGYLEFCRKIQEEYDCGIVVHIGDAVDNHAVSYHEKDPEGMSAGDEFNLALERMKRWYYTFPNVKVCIGNHDALPFRKAFSAGLPKTWLKTYQELLQSPPTWEWDFVHQVNGVIYQHGTGLSGEMAAINAARENRQSTVIGHLHTVMNTRFLASYKDLIFGVTVGCGIDHEKYAFAYGKQNTRKPVVACAVILDGKLPINIPMPI
jgi:predicted phosphodiesterase